MTRRWSFTIAGLLCASGGVGAAPPGPLTFEAAVQQSDRIVIGAVRGPGGESVTLPEGGELALGFKDPSTGLVFTTYRIRIAMCLLDADASCRPGDSEISIPGGTIYETVEGERRLRTWEVAGAAGVPLPPSADEVLLFLRKRGDRYFPFLSAEGRAAAESIPLDRLKELVLLAREVPKPTSGACHAIPDLAEVYAAVMSREHRVRLRTGDDAPRRETLLGLRDDPDPIHGTDDDRWTCGP